MKSKVHKLDVDNLVPVHTDLNKLSDVLKYEVVKKDGYEELVTKVSAINNSDLDEKIETLAAQAEIKSEQDNSEIGNIWFKSFYWSKLLCQWCITKFLNI